VGIIVKKITILALHLGYGGVEKAIATLSNILVENYEVEIISVYKLFNKPVFDINNKVKIRYLLPDQKPNMQELKQTIKQFHFINFFKQLTISIKILKNRKYRMIEAIKKLDSDIVISTRILFTKWLSKYGKRDIIKIAQEHRHHNGNRKYIDQIVKACKNIDYLMPVSKELTDFYIRLLNGKKTKCIFIPLALSYIPPKCSRLDKKSIISIGRLSKEKGFLDLLDVFKLVNIKKTDWRLNIIGDGLEKSKIEQRIRHHKLEKKVIMHGYRDQKYIGNQLSNCSLYVMTSFEESFGLVLLEAQSYGIPCIAFDSAKGAREIIKNNENGYLVKNRDINKMAKAIVMLIENPKLRQSMGRSARNNALKYSKDVIAKQWFNFINEITSD
jgi:glycosyltransferase involved in cell wall biosynthesis